MEKFYIATMWYKLILACAVNDGFTYTSSNLDGSGKSASYPGDNIYDCADVCTGDSACTGYEYNIGGDENDKCIIYTGNDLEFGSQKSTWQSCIKGTLFLLLLLLSLLWLIF